MARARTGPDRDHDNRTGTVMHQISIFAAATALAFVAGAASAQTKWDMPTPYPPGEFHTVNIVQFADEVKKATGGEIRA